MYVDLILVVLTVWGIFGGLYSVDLFKGFITKQASTPRYSTTTLVVIFILGILIWPYFKGVYETE